MPQIFNSNEILLHFKNIIHDEESEEYIQNSCERYVFLLKIINNLINNLKSIKTDKPLKILDIGSSFQTELIRINFPDTIVNTLGFENEMFKARSQDKHFNFDLNNSQFKENWPIIEQHDLIVMAEVIEHLYTSPNLVLSCVSTFLKKDGYLIVSNPNAISLSKRLKILRGIHPYEMIRETKSNPGHFREYTLNELINIGNNLGFEIKDYFICNNVNRFINQNFKRKIYNFLCFFISKNFYDNITIIYKKKN